MKKWRHNLFWLWNQTTCSNNQNHCIEYPGLPLRWPIHTSLHQTLHHLFVCCVGAATPRRYEGKDSSFLFSTLLLKPAQGPLSNKHSVVVDELGRNKWGMREWMNGWSKITSKPGTWIQHTLNSGHEEEVFLCLQELNHHLRSFPFKKKLFYCCSITVVCIFFPPQPNPPPSPASTLPLGFVYVSFIVVPENRPPHSPFSSPPFPFFPKKIIIPAKSLRPWVTNHHFNMQNNFEFFLISVLAT